jgi:SAM-dependent methyltransferase
MNNLTSHKINLNNIIKYSDWLKKFINLENKKNKKNKKEIFREFELEKWSSILKLIKLKKNISIDEIDSLHYSSNKNIAFSLKDEIYLAKPLLIRKRLAKLISDEIFRAHDNKTSIAELGAGTGVIVSRIAQEKRFQNIQFYASDLSPSSMRIINRLKNDLSLNIKVTVFNFESDINLLNIPKQTIIFTSFSLAYFKNISWNFWRNLSTISPKKIIIAEPIFEFYDESTLLGMLRRRYYLDNDYSTNIYQSLVESIDKNILKIERIDKNVIGLNPFCPISIITISFII